MTFMTQAMRAYGKGGGRSTLGRKHYGSGYDTGGTTYAPSRKKVKFAR